jgi:hypothetical protein
VKTTQRSGCALLVFLLGGCAGASLAPDGSARDGNIPADDAAPEPAAVAEAGVDTSSPATLPDGSCKTNASRNTPDSACTCFLDLPDACEASCVDLATDDDNCGACGHACAPQAACVDGACGPSPQLAVGKPAVCGEFRLAAAGGALYWTDTANGTVRSLGGVAAQVSGPETKAPTLLFASESTVVWLDGKTIRRSTGGGVSEVYTSPDDVNGLTTSEDGGTVYFSTGSRIQSVPSLGGAPPIDVLVRKTWAPGPVAVAGDYLASVSPGAGDVTVIQLSGPTPDCDATDSMGRFGGVNCGRVGFQHDLNASVTVVLPKVIFVDSYDVKMNDVTILGSVQPASVAMADERIRSMFVSGGKAYFDYVSSNGDPTKSSTIERVQLAAGAKPVPLARNVYAAGSIAVAGRKLYWVTGDCDIDSVPTGE